MRLGVVLFLIIFGLILPSWIFIVFVFIASIFFINFWEVIGIMLLINIFYVYQDASFQALYLFWGVGIFLVSWIIHNKTRFNDSLYGKK